MCLDVVDSPITKMCVTGLLSATRTSEGRTVAELSSTFLVSLDSRTASVTEPMVIMSGLCCHTYGLEDPMNQMAANTRTPANPETRLMRRECCHWGTDGAQTIP